MCDPADRLPDSYGVGAVLEPGVVLDGAEVAESEAPPAAAGSLGDDPCAAGPVPLAVLARSRVGRPGGAGGAQQRVLRLRDISDSITVPRARERPAGQHAGGPYRPGDAVAGAAAPAPLALWQECRPA